MELIITCLGAILLPAGVTIIAARILIYQLHASPQHMGRLGAILGATCLIWIALAGCALWWQHTCLHAPAPCASSLDPCKICELRLLYPVLFNAVIVFGYAVLHLLWALYWVRHELW